MAEEIGRRVAYELTSNFAKLGSDLMAQQSKVDSRGGDVRQSAAGDHAGTQGL